MSCLVGVRPPSLPLPLFPLRGRGHPQNAGEGSSGAGAAGRCVAPGRAVDGFVAGALVRDLFTHGSGI